MSSGLWDVVALRLALCLFLIAVSISGVIQGVGRLEPEEDTDLRGAKSSKIES